MHVACVFAVLEFRWATSQFTWHSVKIYQQQRMTHSVPWSDCEFPNHPSHAIVIAQCFIELRNQLKGNSRTIVCLNI